MIIKFFTPKKNNKNTTPNLVSGFTLVEAMFAVFILTFTIVGLMTVVSDSLFAARYARDEITANYLLQEAVDYIRNDRDSTVFLNNTVSTDVSWPTFYQKYEKCSTVGNGCALTVSTGKIESCPDKYCYLYYDSTGSNNTISGDYGSFYNYSDSGKRTNFSRKIIVSQGADTNEIDVKVTVSWKNGNTPKEVSLQTSLLRWQ